MKTHRPRINQQIRAPEVRVIDRNGKQIGTMSSLEALNLAKEKGLDLVEVASKARPPVVRILDFKKYRFERKQQGKKGKAKASGTKELRFGPSIGPNDLQIRATRAKEFLSEGNKVKLTVQFKGREISHPEIGFEKIKELIKLLSDSAQVEQEPTRKGRFIHSILGPR